MAEILTLELGVRLGQLQLYDDIIKVSEDEAVYHQIEISSGASDFSVDLGGVGTTDVLFIFSDQNISMRLVAAGTSIPIDANRPAILTGTSFTSVLLSNSSGSTANVKILIAGT